MLHRVRHCDYRMFVAAFLGLRLFILGSSLSSVRCSGARVPCLFISSQPDFTQIFESFNIHSKLTKCVVLTTMMPGVSHDRKRKGSRKRIDTKLSANKSAILGV